MAGKQTFTILHTNDMHSAFIGMGAPRRTTHRLPSMAQDPRRVRTPS
jgi:2',3'-cyclic-nucleotide 2'-phosphodiesterase (5'-nucleotidase family)